MSGTNKKPTSRSLYSVGEETSKIQADDSVLGHDHCCEERGKTACEKGSQCGDKKGLSLHSGSQRTPPGFRGSSLSILQNALMASVLQT